MFADDLKQKGWTEIANMWEYAKGDWEIHFDTSSWMMLETKNNPRVFDVHVPGDYESGWTVNLIEHLCKMEDERHRLREALKSIRDSDVFDQAVRSIAKEALEQCYHTWLVNMDVPEGQPGRIYCPICGRVEKQRDDIKALGY
jgi:hypothetical protein